MYTICDTIMCVSIVNMLYSITKHYIGTPDFQQKYIIIFLESLLEISDNHVTNKKPFKYYYIIPSCQFILPYFKARMTVEWHISKILDRNIFDRKIHVMPV